MIETLKCLGAEVERLARARGFRVEVSEDAARRLVEREIDPLPATRRHGTRGQWIADPVKVEAWFVRQRFQILTDGYPRERGIE